jgi:sulfur carrier protein ThiS
VIVTVEERSGARELELPLGSTVADAARAAGVLIESAVFLLGDRPVPSDEPLAPGARLRIVSAVSGG